jgi:hypothetical protein
MCVPWVQVFAVMVIAFGMYVLANMYWISDLVEVRGHTHPLPIYMHYIKNAYLGS